MGSLTKMGQRLIYLFLLSVSSFSAAEGSRILAEIRGESLLQKCLAVTRLAVSETENRVIFKEWSALGGALDKGPKAFQDQMAQAQIALATLSEPARDRSSLILHYMNFQSLMRSNFPQILADERGPHGLTSLVTEIMVNNPYSTPEQIAAVTGSLALKIKAAAGVGASTAQTLQALVQLEDSLIREMQRSTEAVRSKQIEFSARMRPALFLVMGGAAFSAAVASAEPMLLSSVAYATSMGLSEGVGQFAAMTGIAAIGSTGIDIINDIVIPLYVEAVKDMYRRHIPLSCAITKQAEISKSMELEKITSAAVTGGISGAGVAGATLLSYGALNYLAGKGWQWGISKESQLWKGFGKSMKWAAMGVDEVALVSVAGLVFVGLVHEGIESGDKIQSALSFQGLAKETGDKIAAARENGQLRLAHEYQETLDQIRSIQTEYAGDATEHLIDFAVCGYLMYHLAHGDFMIALEGELEEVLTVLANSSDDAPTGLNAAVSAVKKYFGAKGMSPADMKLVFLRSKLSALESGRLTASFKQTLNKHLEMSDGELDKLGREARLALGIQE